ncbi:EpsG family protein [uncultured Croceitalea sp.]|uniref:EpsG family protein n=1 Tax=uncultured Croceitalea sp. TaxID=1798908 RepID=UPI003305765D
MLFFAVLVLFINREYDANIDLPLYMDFYRYNVSFADIFISKTAWKGDFFFFAIMPVSHFFGFDKETYISFQLVISIFLTFFAYHLFFKQNKSRVFLAFFFMLNSSSFYLIQGNVIRQGLASSLLLLSLSTDTVHLKRVYKILAFFSHKGSVFVFLSRYFSFNKDYRLATIVLAFLIGYFSLFVHILFLFPIPEFVQTKLDFYSSFQRASSNSIIKLGLLLLFNLLFLIAHNRKGYYKTVYSFFFSFSIAALLLFRFDGIFSRLILYTDIFLPILIIEVIERFKTNKNRAIVSVLMIGASMLYSVYVFNHKSILFNMGEYFRLW